VCVCVCMCMCVCANWFAMQGLCIVVAKFYVVMYYFSIRSNKAGDVG
jgi:hypothetical protein